MTPAEAGQVTTLTIICVAIAAFFFWLGLLALADAEERENREREDDRREDWRHREIERTPAHWPPLEASDEEMSA